MSTLDPDRSQIDTFVRAVFKRADPDTYVSLRAFNGDAPFGRWKAVKLNGQGFDPLVDAACTLAKECADAEPGRPVFCPPIASFQSARGASEANLANGLVLTVECDDFAQDARERLEGILGQCTVVVASGGQWVDPLSVTGEPLDKLHLHWRLTAPTRTAAEHAMLKEARRIAAQLVGADATAITTVHPLRWPGSWHRKQGNRLARIVACNTGVEIHLGEALDLLRSEAVAAGIKLPEEVKREPNKKLVGDIRDVIAALEVIPNRDSYWPEWNNKIGLATWGATAGSEEGFEAFDTYSQKSEKYDYATTRERWDHYSKSPPNRIGIGSLIYQAREAEPTWRKPSDDIAEPFDDVDDAQSQTRVQLRSGNSYTPKAVEWLWQGYLARGKFHLLSGQKGVGKSTLLYSVAAIITNGGIFPDGTRAPIGDVLVWSGEDDIEDTILPRFLAAGGDRSRINPNESAWFILPALCRAKDDDNGVRATMTASWLKQMGWNEVAVLIAAPIDGDWTSGPRKPHVLGLDGVTVDTIGPAELQGRQAAGTIAVVDLDTSRSYAQGHIPGAWFAIRWRLPDALAKLSKAEAIVLTSPDGTLAQLAAADLAGHSPAPVRVLAGGTEAWIAAGLPLETGHTHMASEPDDVVLSARERGQGREEAMREYLAWEIDLVNQMATDDDQRFQVVIV